MTDIDLFSADTVRDPYRHWEAIRAEGPVVWNRRNDCWMIVNDALCRKILGNNVDFTVEGTIGYELFGPDAFISIDERALHDRLRSAWVKAFHFNAVAALRPEIQRLLEPLLDGFEQALAAGSGTADVVKGFARDLPAHVIAHLLGVDPSMRAAIVQWSDTMADAALTVYDPDAPQWQASHDAAKSLGAFLADLVAYRRENPGDDLVSAIVHSEAGQGLPHDVIVANCRQLLFAGNETTAKWIAQCIYDFARLPGVWDTIRADRALIPAAVEEVMRWDPIIHLTPRVVKADRVAIGGVTMERGQRVSILAGAANRDPDRHDRPDVFDMHRKQKGHLGFGFGMHACLGAMLARLETATAIERFMERFGRYRIDGPIEYDTLLARAPRAVTVSVG